MGSIITTNWQEVKNQVRNCNFRFYELIEHIAPSNNFPLYLAKYEYGVTIGFKNKFFIPNNKGGEYALGSQELPNDLAKDLNYGKNSAPLGLILNNFCEWLYPDESINYPFAIQGDGTIFNQQIIFQEEQTIENNTISLHSGAKSIFMLPYIGCQLHHEKIKNYLGIETEAPKSPHEHYNLFREIIVKTNNHKNWHSSILFFSEDWISQIRNNPDWLPVKFFFSENLRKKYNAEIYNSFYSDLFMTVKSVNKYRPTPFLIDTAKYIFNLIMGKGIGYIPAINSKLLPIEIIQTTYDEIYNIPYTPTIMVPTNFTENINCIYYSLQQPSKKINTFKIRMNNSTYRELVALKKLLLSYLNEFSSPTSECYGSNLYHACQNISIDFFHNKPSDPADNILLAKNLLDQDKRFIIPNSNKYSFSSDAKFFRGCLRIFRT
ncbi:TPA: hypothetical protein ACPSKY_000745 [Legionella bozemanae]|uniref:hypothetical protein n=1 Tax=Legionella bozemanae TaxID=447 RepID=UPI0010411588|nr:hypothetical protein [Legionella bozemanae]